MELFLPKTMLNECLQLPKTCSDVFSFEMLSNSPLHHQNSLSYDQKKSRNLTEIFKILLVWAQILPICYSVLG